MDLSPLRFADLSTARVSFGSCTVLSMPYSEVLVIAFEGYADNAHEHHGTFAFMRAMIAAGLAAWEPSAVVLDLRGLAYEWGDDMHRVLAVVEGFRPLAIVASGLNREGLTSLITQEMFAQPKDWLFESVGEAIAAVGRALLAQRGAVHEAVDVKPPVTEEAAE